MLFPKCHLMANMVLPSVLSYHCFSAAKPRSHLSFFLCSECSYKPQKISPKFEGTVRQLLHKKIRESYLHPQFNTDVMKPLNIEALMDQDVQNLSGGWMEGRCRPD